MTDIDKFVHDQLSVWPAVAAKYRALKTARTRQIRCGGLLVTLQSNPGRLPIFDHGCPLCEENYMERQHSLPFEGRKGRKYNILVNRAPIFPNHLVITRDVHVPQTIWHRFPDMLDLAAMLDNYIIFYNSPNSGTSVPSHAHFQACPKGYMPLERVADRLLRAFHGPAVPENLQDELEFAAQVRDAQMFHYKRFNRGIFFMRASTSKSMAKIFYRLLDCLNLFAEETEPRFNAFTYFSEGEHRAVVTLRGADKPHHFYATGDDNFAISPGAADMAGFVVVPQEKDFDRITPEILAEIYDEVSLPEADEKRLLWRLVRTQPRIEVGIERGTELSFEIISDGAGPQKVSYREGKIDYGGVLYDELVFEAPTISTLFAEPSFILYSPSPSRYAGTLKFVVDCGKVQAVNIIGLEDYLAGVLESSGEAEEGLPALAMETRKWALEQMERRQAAANKVPSLWDNGLCGTPSLVTWLDTTGGSTPAKEKEIQHLKYDVCATEGHCRAYRGLMTGADAGYVASARRAVDESWGQA